MKTMVSSESFPASDELAGLALFRGVDMADLEPLLRECEVREVPTGAVLIQAEQANDRLYLVLSGEVGVHLGSPASPPIVTLGRGETVGELSLIDKRPTSAFVVARAPTPWFWAKRPCGLWSRRRTPSRSTCCAPCRRACAPTTS
jgi:signal-transduction protein with cAMP-binding, CBS, and nucleotidyltransferase domain